MHMLAALTWAQIIEDFYRLLLLPVLTVLAALLVARLGQKYGAKLDADTRGKLQMQLQQHALDAAATVYQQTVKDLKDPRTPGDFTPTAKLDAKEAALSLLTKSAGAILETLSNGGSSQALADQVIERAVVELGTRTPAGTDPKPASRVEVTSQPPSAPASAPAASATSTEPAAPAAQ